MARRLAGSEATGDDIAQVTFLTAWQKISTYAGGTFSAWICTICFREFLQWRRRQKMEIEFDETAEIIPFDRSADQNEMRMDLARALESLSEAQRVCVVLCVSTGLTHQEAADVTGWPLGTVKSHVLRGVALLRTRLENANVA